MARAGSINVTFTGDASQAKRAIGDVERSLDGMAAEAKRAADRIDDSSDRTRRSLDDIDGAAGNTERGFRGLNDGIGGTTAVLGTFGVASGGTVGAVGGMIQGFTDLAGFVGDFAVQIPPLLVKMGILTAATEAETGAQYALNTAFFANPIVLVVAALVALAAAFYLAWTKSETFREIVTGAFDAVVGAAQFVWHWIVDNWPWLAGALAGPFGLAVVAIIKYRDDIWNGIKWLLDTITFFFGQLGGVLAAPFTHLFDVAKWAWENVYDGIKWLGDRLWDIFSGVVGIIDSVISKVKWVIDNTVGAVQRAGGFVGGGVNAARGFLHLAEGGIVPARPGGTLALIGEGGQDEAVIPLNRLRAAGPGGGGDTYIFNVQSFDPAAAGRVVQEALLDIQFRGGRTVAGR